MDTLTRCRCVWSRRIALFTATLGLSAATADTVTLADGSRVVGDVIELMDGKLKLSTQFAGELVIDADQIVNVEIDETVNVGMATGDRLVGPIEFSAGLDQPMVATQYGGVPIDMSQVAAIWLIDAKSPEVRAIEAEEEQRRAELEAMLPKWSFVAELGFNKQEGNTETTDLRGNIELIRQTPKNQLKFYLSGEYGEDNQVRDTAEVKGGIYYEHLLTERLFAFITNENEYDEFEDIELRFQLLTGVGYYFFREDAYELKGRGGVGFLHESFISDRDSKNVAQMDVGLDGRIDIAPWLRYVSENTYRPTFDGIDDYRLVFDNSLVIPIGNQEAWKVRIGVLNEYDSKVPVGVERLDTTYYANLQFSLEDTETP